MLERTNLSATNGWFVFCLKENVKDLESLILLYKLIKNGIIFYNGYYRI